MGDIFGRYPAAGSPAATREPNTDHPLPAEPCPHHAHRAACLPQILAQLKADPRTAADRTRQLGVSHRKLQRDIEELPKREARWLKSEQGIFEELRGRDRCFPHVTIPYVVCISRRRL